MQIRLDGYDEEDSVSQVDTAHVTLTCCLSNIFLIEIRKKLKGKAERIQSLQSTWSLFKITIGGAQRKCIPERKKGLIQSIKQPLGREKLKIEQPLGRELSQFFKKMTT